MWATPRVEGGAEAGQVVHDVHAHLAADQPAGRAQGRGGGGLGAALLDRDVEHRVVAPVAGLLAGEAAGLLPGT